MTEDLTIREPFSQHDQQRGADFLGMYVFLATEAMLFGGLFAVALAYRLLDPEAVASAARHLKLWIGAANTAILLTSSLAMAIAVYRARLGHRGAAVRWLLITGALGLLFLSVKGYEYAAEYAEGLMPYAGLSATLPGAEILHIHLYYIATALHAFHLTAGVLMVFGTAWRVLLRSVPLPGQAVSVEMMGLYWHFVDVIWVFLYPVLYLPR